MLGYIMAGDVMDFGRTKFCGNKSLLWKWLRIKMVTLWPIWLAVKGIYNFGYTNVIDPTGNCETNYKQYL